MNHEATGILIAGGGVAGLAVANALASRGIRATVLERTKCVGEVDRGDIIHDSMIALFARWRIDAQLENFETLRFHQFEILNELGRSVFAFDLRSELPGHRCFTSLRHPEIERFLEQSAVDTGLVTVERGVRCERLLVQRGRVMGVETSAGTYDAACTVVATGSLSSLPEERFGRASTYDYGVRFLNIRCKQIERFANKAWYILGPRGVMVMVPLPNDEMRIGLQFRPEQGHLSKRTAAEQIQDRFAEFPIEEFVPLEQCTYRLTRMLREKFAIPGAVLVGDAAHATHPVGGQGMNLAFQDAEVLASILHQKNLQNEKTLNTALMTYHRQRKREILPVFVRTHVMGLMGCIESEIYVRVREYLLQRVSQSPTLKKLVFQRITDVR